ncbi:hypothetical protein A3Q56_05324 [Intoshia linei]|uniref:Uncharacterized protein n=1 Tax=Intoshia linei TaxID=1819745 RepID=A0A177AZX6_9BILA|nr:hypothetical protein A3Q56_05324 [Intoshia linei]
MKNENCKNSNFDVHFFKSFVNVTLELLHFNKRYESIVHIVLLYTHLTSGIFAFEAFPLLIHSQKQIMLGKIKDLKKNEIVALVSSNVTPAIYVKNNFANLIFKKISVSVPLNYNYYINQYHEILKSVDLSILLTMACRTIGDVYIKTKSLYNDFNEYSENNPLKDVINFYEIPNNIKYPHLTFDEKIIKFLNSKYFNANYIIKSYMSISSVMYKKDVLSSRYYYEFFKYQYVINSEEKHVSIVHSIKCLFKIEEFGKSFEDLYKKILLVNCKKLKFTIFDYVYAGIVLTTFAKYCIQKKTKLNVQFCVLAAKFFRKIYEYTPNMNFDTDQDYSLFCFDDKWKSQKLLPNINLFWNKYTISYMDFLSSLEYLSQQFISTFNYRKALPILALAEYYCLHVYHDTTRMLQLRIKRLRVLTDLKLYAEAFQVLMILLNGLFIPMRLLHTYKPIDNTNDYVQFTTSKSIFFTKNLMVSFFLFKDYKYISICELAIEWLCMKRLSSNLGSFYGSYLTCILAINQCHLITSIASHIIYKLVPATSEDTTTEKNYTFDDSISIKTQSNAQGILGTIKPNQLGVNFENSKSRSASNNQNRRNSKDDRRNSVTFNNVVRPFSNFTDMSIRNVALNQDVILDQNLKKFILSSAFQICSDMTAAIIDNYTSGNMSKKKLNCIEMEIIIECRFILISIYLQEKKWPYAQLISESIISLLKISNIFENKIDCFKLIYYDDISSQYKYQEIEVAQKFNMGCWFRTMFNFFYCKIFCYNHVNQSRLLEGANEMDISIENDKIVSLLDCTIAFTKSYNYESYQLLFLILEWKYKMQNGYLPNIMLEKLKKIFELYDSFNENEIPPFALNCIQEFMEYEISLNYVLGSDKCHDLIEKFISNIYKLYHQKSELKTKMLSISNVSLKIPIDFPKNYFCDAYFVLAINLTRCVQLMIIADETHHDISDWRGVFFLLYKSLNLLNAIDSSHYCLKSEILNTLGTIKIIAMKNNENESNILEPFIEAFFIQLYYINDLKKHFDFIQPLKRSNSKIDHRISKTSKVKKSPATEVSIDKNNIAYCVKMISTIMQIEEIIAKSHSDISTVSIRDITHVSEPVITELLANEIFTKHHIDMQEKCFKNNQSDSDMKYRYEKVRMTSVWSHLDNIKRFLQLRNVEKLGVAEKTELNDKIKILFSAGRVFKRKIGEIIQNSAITWSNLYEFYNIYVRNNELVWDKMNTSETTNLNDSFDNENMENESKVCNHLLYKNVINRRNNESLQNMIMNVMNTFHPVINEKLTCLKSIWKQFCQSYKTETDNCISKYKNSNISSFEYSNKETTDEEERSKENTPKSNINAREGSQNSEIFGIYTKSCQSYPVCAKNKNEILTLVICIYKRIDPTPIIFCKKFILKEFLKVKNEFEKNIYKYKKKPLIKSKKGKTPHTKNDEHEQLHYKILQSVDYLLKSDYDEKTSKDVLNKEYEKIAHTIKKSTDPIENIFNIKHGFYIKDAKLISNIINIIN